MKPDSRIVQKYLVSKELADELKYKLVVMDEEFHLTISSTEKISFNSIYSVLSYLKGVKAGYHQGVLTACMDFVAINKTVVDKSKEESKQIYIAPGTLVLASKYSDGDPNDPWYIGYYDSTDHKGNVVLHKEDGSVLVSRILLRVKPIQQARAEKILEHKEYIQRSGRSIWFWHKCSMSVLQSINNMDIK